MMSDTIGQRIKTLRKREGYTQETFALSLRKKYGLKTTRAVVGKWEIDYQTPEIFTIKCIADFFGVSMDYLTNGSDKKTQPTEIGELSLEEKQWLELFRAIPDEQKQTIIQMIQALKPCE